MPRRCARFPHMKILPKALCAVLLVALSIGAMVGKSGAAGGYGEAVKPTLALALKGGQTTRSARRRGLKLRARCNVACRVKLTARKGRRVLGSGVKALVRRRGTVTVKFNRKGKKALRARRVRFVVKGRAASSSNQKSGVVTKRVTLRRRRR